MVPVARLELARLISMKSARDFKITLYLDTKKTAYTEALMVVSAVRLELTHLFQPGRSH